MATIKSYTDLSQSKTLSKILSLESSDGYWDFQIDGYNLIADKLGYYKNDSEIPCWSLASLLSVLPYPSLHKTFSGWRCDSYNKEGTSCVLGEPSDNPVDACYDMILKLYELNLL